MKIKHFIVISVFIIITVVAAGLWLFNTGPAKVPETIILISIDTIRADHLGCYGNRKVKTPNLDRLAAEGVRFTNVYADGLPTMPMRRVVWTGKNQHQKHADVRGSWQC